MLRNCTKVSIARDIVRESMRRRVNTPWPRRTAQRAFASSRISVAEDARATTARMAFDPASRAPISRGEGFTGMREHLQRKDGEGNFLEEEQSLVRPGSVVPPGSKLRLNAARRFDAPTGSAYHRGEKPRLIFRE